MVEEETGIMEIAKEDMEKIKKAEFNLVKAISEVAYKYRQDFNGFAMLVYQMTMISASDILQAVCRSMLEAYKRMREGGEAS